MRPYVICHMMSSVDGRTLTENWGKARGRDTYEPAGNSFRANAWISGRVTMQRDFASPQPLKLPPAEKDLPKGDFVATNSARSFAIAVDAGGKLHWKKAEIDGDHLIVLLTGKVSSAYRADLRRKGISFLICGSKELDLKGGLEKLGTLFPIKKLLLEGGGHLNGSFLKAGLIDELSLLHLPLADCNPDSPSVFEPGKSRGKIPVQRLKLLKVKKLENDVLWLRYKVEN